MKLFVRTLMAVTLVMSSSVPHIFAKEDNQSKANTPNLAENAKSAMLIERDTGTVLFEKNADEQLPPASMTKIMTMLLIMEAIDNGALTFEDKVRTSEHAASMGGSQIFLEAGEEMTVDEMLRGIAIASGNDASVAMAEKIAGSEEAFVQKMNEKAKELGLKNTTFQNPTGLPAENHYSTARDMAIMAKELLKYEGITKYTGVYEDYLREDTDKKFWLVNTNRLVKFYKGVDGIKTGYTREAKYCLTATAKKDNMRVIAVVFGASTPKDRNAQITKMLDYAFSQYMSHPLMERGEFITEVKVGKGMEPYVNGVANESVSVLTKKGDTVEDVEKVIELNDSIKAPIQKDDELGKLILKKGDKVLSKTLIVAESDVKEASWWKLFKRSFSKFAGLS
ncbi:D-alanyl-D-alanine carboxypeptidase [Bacillus sp. HMF5848]|uniref:D-alanyl-D-alanine carboxypeptidase family protein n=1 Tax=Bacillus sp. HMF5848 TaxID=2495421 RepID=UPI000F7795C7|nr:D-alanyl-D-alanine carboxypeptidase family protein [Bacillus sp. HMF5848]RSK27711.1 D-alanyl-D-alanine carboxypeptidase [Bacillus sp. HMF5848]